ncbi:MAG: bifunctional demethylmenaquinone methyltransferase/2-methoxy-6-polyprenyl-1,4-benzoquinol methylase UbiE [SAR86 cluster bacterium]|uniref:Ubiquinone/menaquinone biosynthesis C-methyltransferase UbiE n=1 Tax=SAR86 cluster bacterium TaxID=2030880 RepID=A0A2A5CJ15_9GAMM|nr:MAG: bifunctional demethylmenaquinone methyltransferase/2-methoxy-6-polyprenyl-1,4-benzoquinol methylase UbiE [SAR86 cluster bacterium]
MNESSNNKTTDFGYKEVPVDEKAEHVANVFHSVARNYDIMNDIMSLGSHRLIKKFTVQLTALRPGQTVLDLAGGTGDFSLQFSPIVGSKGQVVLADINESMLRVGRDRIIDKGHLTNISYSLADAEKLPFSADSFDCICIAYGLRNVTDKDAALRSMFKVTKPGGRVVVLEFSKPHKPLVSKAYDLYSKLWPIAGKIISGDSESYQYLVESIRMHPDQETLKSMFLDAGFQRCEYHDVMDGICAVHIGYKDAA